MKSSSKFISNRKEATTSKLIIVLFCLLIILIPYFVIWVTLGELNLSKVNWFNVNIFNPNYIYVILGLLGLTIIIFLILFFTQKIKIDAIPYILMSHIMGICILLTAYININIATEFLILIRILITLFAILIGFFISNTIVMRILLSSKDSHKIFGEYKNDSDYIKDIKDETKTILKNKDNNDFVEIEKEDQ